MTTITTTKEVITASLRTTSVAAAIVAARFIEIIVFLKYFQFILGSSAIAVTTIITITKDGITAVI